MDSSFIVRRCIDVEEACHYFMTWPIQEGWNFCYDSQELRQVLYPCDPNGFLVGTVTNQAGKETVVSILLSMRVSTEMGWIGCFIVAKDYRGKGIASKTWQQGMRYLKNCRFIGLESFDEVSDIYRHYNFKPTVGSTSNTLCGNMVENVLEKLGPECNQSIDIMDWANSTNSMDRIHQLVQLEEQLIGYNRPEFWKHWLKLYSDDAGAKCLGRKAVFTVGGNGTIRHFACIQPLKNGYIFSLYSDSPSMAKALLQYLVQWIVDSSSNSSNWCISKDHPMIVYVNVCEKSLDSYTLFKSLGFDSVDQRERLFYKSSPVATADSSGIVCMMTLLAG